MRAETVVAVSEEFRNASRCTYLVVVGEPPFLMANDEHNHWASRHGRYPSGIWIHALGGGNDQKQTLRYRLRAIILGMDAETLLSAII